MRSRVTGYLDEMHSMAYILQSKLSGCIWLFWNDST